jgi:hypothetical protein
VRSFSDKRRSLEKAVMPTKMRPPRRPNNALLRFGL